jgi:nucleolar protein 4
VDIPKVTPPAPSASEPSSLQTHSKPLTRGFAFVWFLSKRDAARAIEKVNGASLYAGYAADVKFANKSQIEGRRKIRNRIKSEDARAVAVDWALGKEKWASAQNALKENLADGDQDIMGVDDNDGHEDWTNESSSDMSDIASASEIDADGASADGKGGVNSTSEHPPQPEEGSTLFIRNVPFDTTDDELKTLSVQISSSCSPDGMFIPMTRQIPGIWSNTLRSGNY